MITVLYARLGEASLASLLCEAKERFPHPDCAEYIDALAKKSNGDNARESLAALVLLGRAAEWMGIDTEHLALDRSQNGKPFFRGGEAEFSLTHSRGYVAAALSDDGEVGIDLEASKFDNDKAKRIAQRYFSELEKDEFFSSPDSFFRIWTKKEACVKLLGNTLAEKLSEGHCPNAYYKYFESYGFPLTLCTHEAAEDVTFGEETL